MGQLFWRFISNFFLLSLIASTRAATEEPCTAMDSSSSSPAALPVLFIEVDEASQQDLDVGSNHYVSDIRLHGVYGSKTGTGIQLTFGSAYRTVNPKESFAFELEQNAPFSNKIRLIKPIDRDGPTASVMDDIIFDKFRLKCVPFNNQTLEYWYDVNLLVNDLNDNSPQLSETNIYSAVVDELTPVGSILPITVTATDKDSGLNRQLTYRIQAADDSTIAEHFMIDNETGIITLKKAFDYEGMSVGSNKLQLPIIIHDNGKQVQLTSKVMVNITVTDGDDQGPQFDHPACQRAFGGKCFTPTYNADIESINENTPILFKSSGGGPPMEIKAKDGDALAATIEFQISAVIPSLYKSSFNLKITPPTTESDNDYYTASLRLIKPIDKSALVGTVVYITATENTPRRLFSVARILFKRNKSVVKTVEAEKVGRNYDSETLSLIVVVAILAVIVVIVLCALICLFRRKSRSAKMNGHINEGMSHL